MRGANPDLMYAGTGGDFPRAPQRDSSFSETFPVASCYTMKGLFFVQ